MGAGNCEAFVNDATGAVHSYGDSKAMCGVAAGAIELGIIAQPTRLARTLLIDVGAAWSGEAIVGHKMGFQVVGPGANTIILPLYQSLRSPWPKRYKVLWNMPRFVRARGRLPRFKARSMSPKA